MVRCDFCGLEFDPNCSTEGGCQGCPLAQGCSKVTCPRCGYEMLPEAKLVSWLKKISGKWAKTKQDQFDPQSNH